MKNAVAVVWITVLASSVACADVTMVDAFEPYRADKVRANWQDGELAYITSDATVAGKNENTQNVGYFEAEWFIDAEDWLAAVTEYAQLPNPGRVGELIEESGLVVESGQLVLPWYEASGSDVYDGWDLGVPQSEWNEFRVEHLAAWEFYETVVITVQSSPGTDCVAHFVSYDTRETTLTDGGTYLSATVDFGEHAFTAYMHNGNDAECNDEGSYSVEYLPLYADGEVAALFLPTDEFSEEAADVWPLPVQPFNQNERSAIALLTEGMQQFAESATGYYETDAYQGYPQFLLYFGFFAGTPDAPEDEGDCEGSFCDGEDGGGGEGGGDGISEFCAANPEALMCVSLGDVDAPDAPSEEEVSFDLDAAEERGLEAKEEFFGTLDGIKADIQGMVELDVAEERVLPCFDFEGPYGGSHGMCLSDYAEQLNVIALALLLISHLVGFLIILR